MGNREGVRLAVAPVNINKKSCLDSAGHEHSKDLKMTERFRLADPNTLEMLVTYTDPVFFQKPFTTKRLSKRQIGDRIMDHSCLENEKDILHLAPTLGETGRQE